MEELKALCEPVIKYLEEKYNPHTELVISTDGIKLNETEIWIPRRTANRGD